VSAGGRPARPRVRCAGSGRVTRAVTALARVRTCVRGACCGPHTHAGAWRRRRRRAVAVTVHAAQQCRHERTATIMCAV
jgi:hypothetical protein